MRADHLLEGCEVGNKEEKPEPSKDDESDQTDTSGSTTQGDDQRRWGDRWLEVEDY